VLSRVQARTASDTAQGHPMLEYAARGFFATAELDSAPALCVVNRRSFASAAGNGSVK
jgi:hypothetical protein